MANDAPDGTLIIEIGITIGMASRPPSAVTEKAILYLARLTTSSATYAEVISFTVPADRTFVLSALEIASSNYAKGQFRVTIAGEQKFADRYLQTTFNPTFANVNLAAGQQVLIEAKSDGSTSINVDGAIEGKEIS